MKFAYDTMRGVSARCCWVSVLFFSSCWWFAYYDFALRWRSHLRFGRRQWKLYFLSSSPDFVFCLFSSLFFNPVILRSTSCSFSFLKYLLFIPLHNGAVNWVAWEMGLTLFENGDEMDDSLFFFFFLFSLSVFSFLVIRNGKRR